MTPYARAPFSGFLRLPAGNVRTADLVEVYRTDPLFCVLRDPGVLTGRCGVCEYRDRCGGSRARAYAATGDALGEDPGCVWLPGSAAPAISGGSDTALPSDAPDVGVTPSRADVDAALDRVLDPELGMSVLRSVSSTTWRSRGRPCASP